MNYQMFTKAGNIAVDAVVQSHVDTEVDHKQLYELVYADLERLQTVSAFSECTDTEVREAVYAELRTEFPQLIFRSVRGKNLVDTV